MAYALLLAAEAPGGMAALLYALLSEPQVVAMIVGLAVLAAKGVASALGWDRAHRALEQAGPAVVDRAALIGASTVAGIHALRRSGQVDAVTMGLVLGELKRAAAEHGASADMAAIVEQVKGGTSAVDAIKSVVVPPPQPSAVANVVRRVTGRLA
jgi:hypothetical protein